MKLQPLVAAAVFRWQEDSHPFSALIPDFLLLYRKAVQPRRDIEGWHIEQPFAKGRQRLREPHLHIWPLLKVDAFHEAHLARTQRQDH